MVLPKLPIGLQDFRKIRENGFKYVDKTRYIYQLCQNPGAFFLSRPRRFGKSLTVSTLQELHLGSRELFEGLWIEDKWDWSRKHPVVRLSLEDLDFEKDGLTVALGRELDNITSAHGLNPIEGGINFKFHHLLTSLAHHSGRRVVVLIDDCDAAITHYLNTDIKAAQATRELLMAFYVVLKELDAHLELVLLTGENNFLKAGIFSGFNNLQDTSLHPAYATMLGYTQQELEENFAQEIEVAAEQNKLSREALLDKIRYWYNGYRFHINAEKVYNPVSVNLFFNTGEFENYWFATGTPTFLINLLKQHGLYDFKLTEQSQIEFDSFDLEDLRPYGLLYQTGYLTMVGRDEYGIYQLGYPNYEVENSMLAYLLEAFGGVPKGSGLVVALRLEKAFENDDLEQVMRILQGVFSGIPYPLHDAKAPERFFHAAIHLLFSYMGLRMRSEPCTSEGRADVAVETSQRVYILEFKLDQSAEVALEQIRQKRYHQAFWNLGKPVIAVGVQLSSKTRNIEAWKAETVADSL
ncbi:MAG: AAA family ATPase [Saprospiraceae bacterium]|nr:ATP-binding protein [Saprospiraceae bacterium]MDW8230626.1 AAA family ATPase [Saprospiraceae bacterium]